MLVHVTRAAVVASVGLTLASGPAVAADPALVAAAEREGQLVLYDCDIQETPAQVKRFAEIYPKIKVTTYVASCWQVYNRHAAERGAGKPIADVFVGTDDVMMKLDDEASFERYDSPELAHYPAEARMPGMNYIRHKPVLAAFTVNTDAMKGLPVPQDWTDYASPPKDWQGKVSFYDPRTSGLAFTVLASLHQQLGPEQARRIYAGLRALDAELSASTPAGVAKVLSGEKPIMFYILTNQYGAATLKGAPLSFTVPKSGAVATYFAVAPLKGAAHPNAAKLFADYMLNEGQGVVVSRAEYSLRNGTPAPAGMPALKDIKIMPTDFRKALADQKSLIDWWQGATGYR